MLPVAISADASHGEFVESVRCSHAETRCVSKADSCSTCAVYCPPRKIHNALRNVTCTGRFQVAARLILPNLFFVALLFWSREEGEEQLPQFRALGAINIYGDHIIVEPTN